MGSGISDVDLEVILELDLEKNEIEADISMHY